MAHSALTVAKYFLSIPDEDAGELVSNLKLQKLLYYAQGHAVAANGLKNPLFHDKIYAWKHGPVVKSVYDSYAGHMAGALPREDKAPHLPTDVREFLNEIYRVYGRFSAWALRDMTHKEPPWVKNFRPNVRNIEIPLQDLSDFFSENGKKA